ncbi:hypothetical protein ACFV19_29275 [Streptomyces griseoluteus]|uniref:hypothetical protein n=1 Tax=Streptomyces griseoluteus TaxID=29306 RepID=UPI0036853A8F
MTAPASGTSWTVTASPASVRLHLGESAVVRFTVTDNATTPAQRRGTLAVLPGPGTDASWFTIDQDTRTFAPGGSADFGVTVRPPTGAASGDHRFSCLVFDPEHPTVDTTVQSGPVALTVTPAVLPWKITASKSVVVLTRQPDLAGDIDFETSGPVGSLVTVRVRPTGGHPADAEWFSLPTPQEGTIGASGPANFIVEVGPPNPLGSVVPHGTFVGDLLDLTGGTQVHRGSSRAFRLSGPAQ